MDGYLNVILFRYIAQRFPYHEQAVTVFVGIVMLSFSFAGSLVAWVLVEIGVLRD